MYFELGVKEFEEDFFNYREELLSLENHIIDNARVIAIKGVRRVGKSSLMRVVYNKINLPKSWIDAREVIEGIQLNDVFNTAFEEMLSYASSIEKIKGKIKEIEIKGIRFDLNRPFYGAKRCNEILGKLNKRGVLFIDEVQLLKNKGIEDFIAYVYDHLKNITLVLAGSEVGLLDEILGSKGGSFFGRVKEEIEMKRLEREKALLFLFEGAKQAGISISYEEGEEVISNFDGLVGWLTHYGYYRKRRNHKEAIQLVKSYARQVVRMEWNHFLSKRRERGLFNSIIMALSKGLHGWEDIRKFISGDLKREVKAGSLDFALNELISYGFVEKRNGYFLADPLFKEIK